MKPLTLVFILLIGSGCTPPVSRGNFTLLSTKPIQSHFELLSNDRVEGKACFNQLKAQLYIKDAVFEAATTNALNKYPSSTILIDASYRDTGNCIEVSGMPAKEI